MNAVALLEQARKLMSQRQVTQSLETFQQLTSQYPQYAEGWFHYSGTQSGLGQTLSAVTSAMRALDAAPTSLLYRAHLAQMQTNYGLWGDAIATIHPARSRSPTGLDARIQNSVGSVLSLCGVEQEAQQWFAAAASGSASATYLYNEAQGLVYCGRMNEAREAFEQLIRRHPDFAKGHWALSSFDAGHQPDARLARLRSAITRASSPMDEVMYCYALFNTLDAIGLYDEAFAELEHGMRLQRARIGYSGEGVERLHAFASLATKLPAYEASESNSDARPIFILGMPRSGTTLVERILGNHPEVAQGGELFCFGAALHEHLGIEASAGAVLASSPLHPLTDSIDWQLVGERYLDLTAYKRGQRRYLTDKYPFNLLLVPWIARALPQARILHVQRDPMDTCFSNLRNLFTRSYGACYDQADMGQYYAAYRRLMDHYEALLPGLVLQVRYEALIDRPEETTRRMLEFCALDDPGELWRVERNTQAVSTASTTQVREPLNRKGLGTWKRYEKRLRPLRETLIADHVAIAEGE